MKKIIIALLIFLVSLYIVEASPIGSREVAKYNDGYGTFDMKDYDADTVDEVLSKTEDKGFDVYNYYVQCLY